LGDGLDFDFGVVLGLLLRLFFGFGVDVYFTRVKILIVAHLFLYVVA
jgi:hypothetical protein